jgi:N-acetylglucosaminyldiphosphoundecaprenol N-acetyl-beta-D-mannosaminyltransferase
MRIKFLGIPIDSLDMQEALQRVDDFVASGEPKQILVANVNKLWQIRHDPRLARIAQQANLVIPERVLVMTSGLLGPRLKSDVCGVAIAKALLPHCEKVGHSIFFLGARPAVLETLIQRVRRDYPKLRVAGYHHGYFLSDDDEALRMSIRKAQPDVLLVALGSPRQEYWIHDHMSESGVPVSIGVGGTFDVIAGIKKDAPKWIRKCAIECFYRLGQNPTNLWKRYSITIPWFLGTILLECVKGRKSQAL